MIKNIASMVESFYFCCMNRKKLLEIILAPDYQGLTTRKLAKLVFEDEELTSQKIIYIQATISQLMRRGFLRKDGKLILPTDTTKNYYDFLIKYRLRNKEIEE